ncbi:MAG: hypothetical protein KJ884_18135 [Gammaproteobacteria bacterium]|nr:hypothetical protein [Gammaproteobacteria bacterium]MBU1489363.1 hypothetical protein [Gammaproteobacteria bacterium]MBU2065244.1 hypothetical protein [Gammaproteobacteria bacterium]MBU2141125.1 hypothetical protein [Gammaproteobacteria bacterium]MBU2215348.1 hypothetical protein [Gammaproteobacteria bacterium]
MQRLAKTPEKRTALVRGAYLLAVLMASYAAIWVLTGFMGIVLLHLGSVRSEAAIFSTLLGFVLYPALVIAALAAKRPLRLWVVLMAASAFLAVVCDYWGVS